MKKIDFLATDGIKLNGFLYEGKEKTNKIVLSIHGMSSNCLKKREDIFSSYMNENNIDVPLFMRWGNDKEMILQKADELVALVNNLIINEKKDIDYIEGSNHSYNGKEEIVAEQIIEFINK